MESTQWIHRRLFESKVQLLPRGGKVQRELELETSQKHI